jgi:hypothetical protein
MFAHIYSPVAQLVGSPPVAAHDVPAHGSLPVEVLRDALLESARVTFHSLPRS